MLNLSLRPEHPYPSAKNLRICAVSYLNTVPLVWGFLHGQQQGLFDLDFAIPAECADRLASGAADIGIVPVAELPRLNLDILRGAGIACHGAVRSILLVSRIQPEEIQTLAVDASSRTSVQLARVILQKRYGTTPELIPMEPHLDRMLAAADAALIIGDPALHLDPEHIEHEVLDLGAEWTDMTGLPMVFAVWAAQKGLRSPELELAFRDSLAFGKLKIIQICESAEERGIPYSLAYEYLTRHIVFELGEREYKGMDLFLRYVSELGDPDPAAKYDLRVV